MLPFSGCQVSPPPTNRLKHAILCPTVNPTTFKPADCKVAGGQKDDGPLRITEARSIYHGSQNSEERWQHAGDGRKADKVVGDQVLLPGQEHVGADDAVTSTRQTAVSQHLSVVVQLVAEIGGHCHSQAWQTYRPRSLPPLQQQPWSGDPGVMSP